VPQPPPPSHADRTPSATAPFVAITGASGLIGHALLAHLRGQGRRIRRLVRSPDAAGPDDIVWDPTRGALEPRALEGADAVVHLAGEPLAQRWTSARRTAIRESRVRGTELLARTIAALDRKPSVLLSGSAVGYYGDRGDEAGGRRERAGYGLPRRSHA
jgi:NAD dependent epimerase/dehydratase family enzyme